jgi:hypothetical protein
MGSTARQLELQDEDKAAVFQGGNYVDLHQMMGVKAGTEVLYVGDHIYGDILRSKKVSCWLFCPLTAVRSSEGGVAPPAMAAMGSLTGHLMTVEAAIVPSPGGGGGSSCHCSGGIA